MDNLICVYHANCADGFTSAWIVNQYYNGAGVDFIPGVHGNVVEESVYKGKDVLFVDFSFKRDIMVQILKSAKSVTVLDHHHSAEGEIKSLMDSGDISGVFDMNRSGAGITWDYFFPNTLRPELVDYVEDRDIWKFELPNTKAFNFYVFSFPYTFDNWDKINQTPLSEIIAEGKAIERKHFKDLDELIENSAFEMEVGGIKVPVINVPYTMGSDVCDIMRRKFNSPFAAYFYSRKGEWYVGMRSDGESFDVSKIAEKYGGGGHKGASAFVIKDLKDI